MTTPDTSSRTAEAEAPKPDLRQPLSMRIYYQRHMTDLVRSFGYDAIPLEEAQERAKALVAQYGEEKVRAASDELTEVDHRAHPPVVRLKEDVLTLAVGILGRRPESTGTATKQESPDTPAASAANAPNDAEVIDANTADSDQSRDPSESDNAATDPPVDETAENHPEVKLSRDQVLGKFIAWLNETKKTYVQLLPARAAIGGEKAFAPDVIIFGDRAIELLSVRKKITGKQIADLREWVTRFGHRELEALHVWPVDAGESWIWQRHHVSAEPSGKGAEEQSDEPVSSRR